MGSNDWIRSAIEIPCPPFRSVWDKWLSPLARNVTALMVGSAHPTITITNSNYRERKRNNTQRKVYIIGDTNLPLLFGLRIDNRRDVAASECVFHYLSLKLAAYREGAGYRKEIPALLNTVVVVAQTQIKLRT